jgi:hypothetical protein
MGGDGLDKWLRMAARANLANARRGALPKRAIGKGISTRGVGGLEPAAIEVRVRRKT